MELTIEQAIQQVVAAHNAGNLQEAERVCQAILQSQPKNPDASHNLGLIAISENQIEAALSLFKTALDVNPTAEQFWLSYIDALIKKEQFENAKEVIEQAKEQGLAEEKLNVLQAQLISINQTANGDSASPSKTQLSSLSMYYRNGRYDDAVELAIFITKEFPKHPFGWKVLGVLYGQSGRNFEAVDATKTAVALTPQDAEAHSNLGNTLQELGRLDEAEASCKQAIALIPDVAEAHSNLGNTLQELGRLDEAEVSYKQAIALKPDYAKAHSNLGVTLQELGRLEEAEASYKQAIVLKPDHAEAHFNLCELLEKRNKLDEALLVIRNAKVQVVGKESDFFYFEALIEFRKENYEATDELIKKSIEMKC